MQKKADGTFVAADVASALVNGAFSLMKRLTVKANSKPLYEGNDVNKIIFVKDMLQYSEDYSRTVAKDGISTTTTRQLQGPLPPISAYVQGHSFHKETPSKQSKW